VRTIALALGLLCPAALARQDGSPRAFVELELPHASCFVHEPFWITLRIGVDREFFANHAISVLRRQVDLPVRVEQGVPAGGSLRALPPRPRAGRTLTLARDDEIVAATVVADRRIGDREFTVVELETGWVARQPGTVHVPAPRLRFSHTTRFEARFLDERAPVDRHDETVAGEERTLAVLALPEQGRPREFTGAVGRFTIAAELRPQSLVVGDVAKLTLRVSGDGILDFVAPPRLDTLVGFHVYGRLERSPPGERAWVYELAPLRATLREVPRIRFAYFDPGPPAGYRVAQTEPIGIAVRPLPAGRRLDLPPDALLAGPVAGIDDIHGPRIHGPGPPAAARDPGPAPGRAMLAAGLALPWLLAAAAWSARTARRRALARRRAGAALAAFARATPGANPAQALAELIASHLGCAPAAVIAPGLAERLAAAGVPRELALQAQSQLEALVATRYGSSRPAPQAPALHELARALHLSLAHGATR
jgi:hypothetical protein